MSLAWSTLVAAWLATPSVSAPAQVEWHKEPLLGIRSAHAMTYDAARGRVVLFGAAGVCQDTGKKRAPAYFAVKAALMTVARSLAEEVASSGVTVNVVSPGLILHESSYVESQRRMLPRVPVGRMGAPADVVGAVRFLLSDEASYVTGIDLEVDGGLHL